MLRKNSIYFAAAFLAFAALGVSGAYAFAPPSEGQGGGGSSLLMMMGMIVFIFYFIVIRPQQKEQKAHQERIENLKKGDRVVTSGGVHGVVKTPKEKTVVVEIADGVKVTFNKGAVSAVIENGEAEKD